MDAPTPRSPVGVGGRFAEIRWVEETGSTNDDLLVLARAGAPEQVLVADRQTAGRGRLGRRWEAPTGASLLCSLLLRPDLAADAAHVAPWAVALAALDAVVEVAGVDLALKWPNDLVAVGAAPAGGDAKVAGLLSELVMRGDRVVAVVVGIGVNVNWEGAFPEGLADTATSLDALAGGPVERSALLAALLGSLDRHLPRGSPAASVAERLHREVVARSATIGRQVRVEMADTVLVGRAVEINPSGALVVASAGGLRREVQVGDVVHLRPMDAPGDSARDAELWT